MLPTPQKNLDLFYAKHNFYLKILDFSSKIAILQFSACIMWIAHAELGKGEPGIALSRILVGPFFWTEA